MPAATAKPAAKQSLQAVLADLLKKDDLRVGPMSALTEEVEAISTGNLSIDSITGVDGLPKGRCIECYGAPSSGKSTLAIMCAAYAQQEARRTKSRKKVLYVDFEQTMDIQYCRSLGLDVDGPDFLFAQPDSLEQGLNAARRLADTGEISVIVIDSVAAMTPEKMLEADAGTYFVGLLSKLFSEELRKLIPVLRRTEALAIFVNHVQDVFDMGGKPGAGKRTTTPGGRALKFYASIRLEFQQVANVTVDELNAISQEKEPVVKATKVRIRCVKNKVASPFKQCYVQVEYGKGFSNLWSALQVLTGHKRVIKAGSGFFYFDDKPDRAASLQHPAMLRQTDGNKRPYIRGEDNIFKFAEEHPEWGERVIALAKSVLKSAAATTGVDMVVITENPSAVDPEEEVSPESDEPGEPMSDEAIAALLD